MFWAHFITISFKKLQQKAWHGMGEAQLRNDIFIKLYSAYNNVHTKDYVLYPFVQATNS